MTNVVVLALMIAAFVLFVLAAVSVPAGRVGLGWAGLACWSLAEIISKL